MTVTSLRRWGAALVAAVVVAAVLPIGVALAATPTVTTLAVSNLSPDRGDVVSYTVTVVPTPPGYGAVSFESSPDGVTWTEDQVLTQWSGQPTLVWTAPVDGSVPLGDRQVRARFQGVDDLEGSMSDAQVQTIGLRQTSITGLIVHSTTWEALVPGSPSMEILCYLWGGGGTVVFEQQDGAAWDELGRKDVTYQGPGSGSGAWIDLPGFPLGTYEIRARLLASAYAAPSEQTITFTMTKAPSNLTVGGLTPVQAHHPVPVSAEVRPPTTGVAITGNITLYDADTNQVLASGPPAVSYVYPSLSLGVHHFSASYEGDANYEAETDEFTITVVPDIVEASSVTVTPSTFYPYKDGYRDTTSVVGMRNEPASVAITIYSPTGSVVRRASIGMGSGHYSFAWNGRTTSGAAAAAGKYKVIQKLTDAFGSTKSVTSYVTLSKKRLYTYTKTLTKTASQSYKHTSSWIGWSFTVPSATVYKALTASVYGQSAIVAGSPGLRMGAWDFRRCAPSATWGPGCVAKSVGVPGPGLHWVSLGLSTTYNRYGHSVRIFVFALPGAAGKVSTARLKVTYALLK